MDNKLFVLAPLAMLILLVPTFPLDAANSQGYTVAAQSPVFSQGRFGQRTLGVISPYSTGAPRNLRSELATHLLAKPILLFSEARADTHRDPDVAIGPAVLSTQSSSEIALLSKFEGLNQIQSCPCVPPDVQVAAGPSQIVEMVNVEGAVYSKQGVVNNTFSLSTFYNVASDSISDPKVLFDGPSQRWFTSLLDITHGEILVGVSTTSDANGLFVFYALSAGGAIPDQPIIGISDDKVALAANDFVGNSFAGSRFWILNKSQLLAGGTVNFFSPSANTGVFSIHPVQSLSNTTTQFLISNIISRNVISTTTLRLFSATGVPGVSTVSVATHDLSISTIGTLSGEVLPGGVEPNTSSTVNTNDFRTEDAVWFKGSLWLGLNDACIPAGDGTVRSCVRLTKISTNSTATVSQDFDFGTRLEYLYYPALRMDRNGNLLVVYGYSNASIFPSLAITGQLTTDPAKTLTAPIILKAGSASDDSTRYGDYFGAALDPADPATVWVAGEYHTSSAGSCQTFGSCWATFIGSSTMQGFTITTSPSIVTLSSVTAGRTNVTLSSINNFAGQVIVNATGPMGITVSPMLTHVTFVSGNASIPLTLSVGSSLAAGPYSVTVVAKNGTISRTASLTVVVEPDFSILLSCACNSALVPGSRILANVTVTSVNGFSGKISIDASIFPIVKGGPSITLAQTNQTLALGGHAIVGLTIDSGNATGIFTITVTVACVSGSCTSPAQHRTAQLLIAQANFGGEGGRRPVLV